MDYEIQTKDDSKAALDNKLKDIEQSGLTVFNQTVIVSDLISKFQMAFQNDSNCLTSNYL